MPRFRCIGAGIVLAGSIVASTPGVAADAVYLQFGVDDTRALTAGWQREWQRSWQPTSGMRLSGFWELSLGRWRTDLDAPGEDRLYVTQVGVTPGLRLSGSSGAGLYLDAAIGASYLRPLYRKNGRRFSTRWNFRDQLGIGYVAGGHDISVRVEHYSNAGVREPNPGITFWVARYGYRY